MADSLDSLRLRSIPGMGERIGGGADVADSPERRRPRCRSPELTGLLLLLLVEERALRLPEIDRQMLLNFVQEHELCRPELAYL